MSRHILIFTGLHARAINPALGPFLRDLLAVLVDGCQRATRLRVDGRSTAPGTPPAWLESAIDFQIAGMHSGEVLLESVPLSKTADRFGQRDLFSEIDPSRSCLDLFEDGLSDALHGHMDSIRYDRPLMETFEDFGRLFKYGIEHIRIVNGRTLDIDHKGVELIKELRTRTPEDKAIVVSGKIDLIRHSDRAFVIMLDSGDKLWGIALSSAISHADLAGLFGKRALVEGVAKYRPSGSILRIEATNIQLESANAAELTGVRLELRRLIEAGHVDEARRRIDTELVGDRVNDLRGLAGLLALPVAERRPRSGRGDFDQNAAWLQENKAAYRGQWVALREGKLVDHDPSYLTLRQRLREMGAEKDTFCAKVED